MILEIKAPQIRKNSFSVTEVSIKPTQGQHSILDSICLVKPAINVLLGEKYDLMVGIANCFPIVTLSLLYLEPELPVLAATGLPN